MPAHGRMTKIFSGEAGESRNIAFHYAEGMAVYDVDGDGKVDLLAGNLWFKHRGGHKFDAIKIGSIGGRIAAGKFKPGKYPQVVIAPGDGIGPLRFYECMGNPENSARLGGRNLLERDMIHGHSLQVADIDGDGQPGHFRRGNGQMDREPKGAGQSQRNRVDLVWRWKWKFSQNGLFHRHGFPRGPRG